MSEHEIKSAGTPVESPRDRAPTTERKLFRATIYGFFGAIFAVVFLQLAFSEVDEPWIFAVIGLPAYYFIRASVRHFKPRLAADEFSLQDLEGKAPVLYLRPFEQDMGWDGAIAFNLFRPRTWRKIPISPSNLHTLYLEMTGRQTFEQVLAYYVEGAGPLVAFGEPGSAPILGATNYYVGDVNWQEKVKGIAGQSALVVLTAGTTEGVMWEIKTMVQDATPERVLLHIPGDSRGKRAEAYEVFHSVASDLFPSSLPENFSDRFLLFDEVWSPVIELPAKPEKNTPAWIAKKMCKTLL